MKLDLTKLTEVAKAATQGEWDYTDNYVEKVVYEKGERTTIVMGSWDSENPCYGDSSNDTAHIATFDPPTVLALLSKLARYELAMKQAKDLLGYAVRNVVCPSGTQAYQQSCYGFLVEYKALKEPDDE